MNRTMFALMMGLLGVACLAQADVQIQAGDDASQLKVLVNGEHFTTYHFSNENRKPFLWPVYAEGQVTVTRDWPMDKDAKESTDHIHHKSMWTSFGDLNGVDCWGEGGDKAGYQQSDKVTYGSETGYSWIKAEDTWLDNSRKPVLSEDREYRFYDCPAGARYFDLTVTFTADQGDVVFGDTKEGGIMAVRMRPEIQANKKGAITNAEGKKGESECWGKPSPWCDYSGDIEGAGVRGVTVMDHPGNLRHPSRWHVRDYGLMGANCFGLSYFTKGEAEQLNGDYTLENGKSVTFRYRVVVHSGTPEEAKIPEMYKAYVDEVK